MIDDSAQENGGTFLRATVSLIPSPELGDMWGATSRFS